MACCANRVLRKIEARGRSAWQVLSGYTRQRIAANMMFRFKQVFRGRLWARGPETHCTEALIKCTTLNRMTHLGMPETVGMR